MNGFGWSFYGFFIAAAAWIAAYFYWAVRQQGTASSRSGKRR